MGKKENVGETKRCNDVNTLRGTAVSEKREIEKARLKAKKRKPCYFEVAKRFLDGRSFLPFFFLADRSLLSETSSGKWQVIARVPMLSHHFHLSLYASSFDMPNVITISNNFLV